MKVYERMADGSLYLNAKGKPVVCGYKCDRCGADGPQVKVKSAAGDIDLCAKCLGKQVPNAKNEVAFTDHLEAAFDTAAKHESEQLTLAAGYRIDLLNHPARKMGKKKLKPWRSEMR